MTELFQILTKKRANLRKKSNNSLMTIKLKKLATIQTISKMRFMTLSLRESEMKPSLWIHLTRDLATNSRVIKTSLMLNSDSKKTSSKT